MSSVLLRRYSATAIALHWVLAIVILANLAFGLYAVGLPLSPQKLKYLSWHKWLGMTALGVAAMRILWRLTHSEPPPPESLPSWERRLARISHASLYVLFFAAPLSGWLYSSAAGYQTVYLGVLPIPDLLGKNRELAEILRLAHRWIDYALAAFVAVHVAGALKHHFHDRDAVLVRMIPCLKPPARRSP